MKRKSFLTLFVFILAVNFIVSSDSFAKEKKHYGISCFLLGDVTHSKNSIGKIISEWEKRWINKGLIKVELDTGSATLSIKAKNKKRGDYCFNDLKRRLMEINIQIYRSVNL